MSAPTLPPSFKAFWIDTSSGSTVSAFKNISLSDLDKGEVLIKVHYSSINYKDALAATGKGRILRRPACIGGIDCAGVVVDSTDSRFSAGDEVFATGFDLGVNHHGGYAQYARMPASWLIKNSTGLSLKDAMAFGTAGFTAALGVALMEEVGLRAHEGQAPVAVTGATGGVGSVAVEILANKGFNVTAITGKADEEPFLKTLGAKQVLLRQNMTLGKKPLESMQWAGAYDIIGGDMLSWLIRSTHIGGAVAACGMASGADINMSVFPFILRGIALLGVDSVNCPMPRRESIWARMKEGGDLRPSNLSNFTHEIAFDDMPALFDDFIHAKIKGRWVVKISE